MKRNPIRSFDLFCGGGGSSLGAQQAGVSPVGGIDHWPIATAAFEENFPDALAYNSDLEDTDPHIINQNFGPIDLLLASPECTNHSVAKGNKPRCEESKQLAFEVIRFAKALKPRWIVVENVIQMRAWHAFPTWIGKLHSLGYNITYPTLEASDFGVPQKRRRLFVICDRERIPKLPRPYRRKNAVASSIIRRTPCEKWSYRFSPLDNGKRAAKTIERAQRAINAVGADKEFIMVYYGSDGAGGYQTLDRPLRTITTLDRFAIVRPNCVGHEMRMLQPSELATAMGFPASYRFPSSATRRDCIKLIGNAVCPPVMRAIVRSLITA